MGNSRVGSAIVVALALLAVPRAALAAQPPDTVTGAGASHWLVELERPPAADGTSQAALGADHTRFRVEARAADIRYRQRFAYKSLFNGMSVSASDAAVAISSTGSIGFDKCTSKPLSMARTRSSDRGAIGVTQR